MDTLKYFWIGPNEATRKHSHSTQIFKIVTLLDLSTIVKIVKNSIFSEFTQGDCFDIDRVKNFLSKFLQGKFWLSYVFSSL